MSEVDTRRCEGMRKSHGAGPMQQQPAPAALQWPPTPLYTVPSSYRSLDRFVDLLLPRGLIRLPPPPPPLSPPSPVVTTDGGDAAAAVLHSRRQLRVREARRREGGSGRARASALFNLNLPHSIQTRWPRPRYSVQIMRYSTLL